MVTTESQFVFFFFNLYCALEGRGPSWPFCLTLAPVYSVGSLRMTSAHTLWSQGSPPSRYPGASGVHLVMLGGLGSAAPLWLLPMVAFSHGHSTVLKLYHPHLQLPLPDHQMKMPPHLYVTGSSADVAVFPILVQLF